jgi:outer membrane receptor protein involved in Fe transport
LADNFSYIHGRHSFKSGFEIRNVMSSRVQGGVPTHTYSTVATAMQDIPNNIQVLFGNPGRPLNETNYGFYGQDDWRINRRLQINMGLRYEYYVPLHGAFNVTGSDPFGPYGTNTQGMFKPDSNNFGPRLGLVFDVFGNQKTVLRTGGGITYAPPQSIFYYSSAFVDPRLPFQTTFTPSDLPPGISSSFPFSQAFVNQVEANPSLLPKNFIPGRSIADYNRADEYAGQWNFTIQQALNKDLALQVAYVGSRALKLFSTRSPNQFLPGAKTRPNPAYADITFAENAGRSSYHGLQISLNQRLRSGLTLDAYYTCARTMSYYGADGTLTSDTSVQDELNIAGSYGPKTGEIRNLFTTILSYQLPAAHWMKGNRIAGAALGGWSVQGIIAARSGPPLNVLSGIDLVGNQRVTGQRPDYIAGVDPYQESLAALTWLNPAAFSNTIPRSATRYGDLGFNALRAPGSIGFDAGLHKTFVIHEQHRLTFRLEAFNAVNHMNPNAPVNTLSNPNFGHINGGSSGRNIQLALKYAF